MASPRRLAQSAIPSSTYLLGDFIWTAISYIGESSLGHSGTYPPAPRGCAGALGWPFHTSASGDLDVTGWPRAQAYFRRVLFNFSTIEMAVHAPAPSDATGQEVIDLWGWPDQRQSWSWNQSGALRLQVVIFCRCDAVTLLLNSKPITPTPIAVNATSLTAEVNVTYSPGHLTALALVDAEIDPRLTARGKPGQTQLVSIANVSLVTAGPPAAIRLTSESPTVAADRGALSYVWAEVVDAHGTAVPDARVWIDFSISSVLQGATLDALGEIAAVGNGDPLDASSFRGSRRQTFQGRCVAIVRPGSPTNAPEAGAVMTLRARAHGLSDGTATIVVV